LTRAHLLRKHFATSNASVVRRRQTLKNGAIWPSRLYYAKYVRYIPSSSPPHIAHMRKVAGIFFVALRSFWQFSLTVPNTYCTHARRLVNVQNMSLIHCPSRSYSGRDYGNVENGQGLQTFFCRMKSYSTYLLANDLALLSYTYVFIVKSYTNLNEVI